MTDLELLLYVIRDCKWKNGCLREMARSILEGASIHPFIDKGNDDEGSKKYQKWFKQIEAEYEMGRRSTEDRIQET